MRARRIGTKLVDFIEGNDRKARLFANKVLNEFPKHCGAFKIETASGVMIGWENAPLLEAVLPNVGEEWEVTL